MTERPSLRWLLRHVASIGIGAVLTGIAVGGVGGRVFMRASGFLARDRAGGAFTANGNRIGEFTAEGTIGFVVFIGLFSGILAAGAYAATEPWLAWAGRWRGPVFGVYLLTLGSTVVLAPGNFDFFVVGFASANVAMIAGLFVAFGALAAFVIRWLEKRLPRDDAMSGATVVYLVLSGLGLFLLVPVLAGFVTGGFCDCEDPPVLIGLLFAGTVVATIGYWVGRVLGTGRTMRLILSLTGHVLVAATFVAGAARVFGDAAEIL